jgi:large exoprotein involved in heme utilization and adhesion
VVAQAGEGRGGAIRIVAEAFVPEDGTLIDASAGDPSLSGSVEIHAPDVNLAGTLTQLPDAPLDASASLRERCAARRPGESRGSFVVRRRDGVPPAPDALLAGGAGPAPAPAKWAAWELGAGSGGPLVLAGACE